LLARLRSFASLSSPSLGLLGGASLAALLLHAAPARAVGTSTWTVETFANFDAGDATDAILTSLGELRPGWDKQRVAVEGDGVWSSLRLADGTVLIGSDDGATIVSIARGGKEAKKVVSIPDAIAVVALTQTPDGTVWAATLPGDKVYKIDLKAGKATPAVTLKGAETVWALAAAPDGTVYAGTGPDGKLWAIKGGAAKEVLATDDKRVGALAVGKDGAVWLGTSERALVFRYDPATGKARAMADFAGNEITAIAIVDGGVARRGQRDDRADAGVLEVGRAGRGRREAGQAEGHADQAARRGHQARRRQGQHAHGHGAQGRAQGQGRRVPGR
jgi:outer membrane protein assembly factor BamB